MGNWIVFAVNIGLISFSALLGLYFGIRYLLNSFPLGRKWLYNMLPLNVKVQIEKIQKIKEKNEKLKKEKESAKNGNGKDRLRESYGIRHEEGNRHTGEGNGHIPDTATEKANATTSEAEVRGIPAKESGREKSRESGSANAEKESRSRADSTTEGKNQGSCGRNAESGSIQAEHLGDDERATTGEHQKQPDKHRAGTEAPRQTGYFK